MCCNSELIATTEKLKNLPEHGGKVVDSTHHPFAYQSKFRCVGNTVERWGKEICLWHKVEGGGHTFPVKNEF